MVRFASLVFALSFLTGCQGIFGNGGQSGEDTITCAAVATTNLASGEDSVLGFGGDAVRGLADGVHDGVLTYDDGSTTPVHVTVSNLSGDRFEHRDWVDPGGDTGGFETMTDMACADQVAVDAHVAFATDDGAFDEGWDTTLTAVMADAASFYANLDLAALGGSFVFPNAAQFDSVSASMNGTFDSTGSHGSIDGQGTNTSGDGPDGTASATMVPLASW